ncbi:MAG: extracellular solute-binding protein [Caldilinea sp.]
MNTVNAVLTRRQMLKAMGAGATLLALAGCAPAVAPGSAPQEGVAAPSAEKTTIRIASWDSTAAEPIEEEVIAAFNEQYPDIEVKMEFNPDAYNDKLLTSMAGGTGADIFLWWNFPGLVAQNGIEDLTPYVEGPNGLDLSIYFKEVLDYNRVGPGLYGLPKDFTPRAYYFNRKLFDEAGIPYPANDWTTDDLLEIAKALTVGEGPDAQYGLFTFSGLYDVQGYVWQHDGDFISPDGTKASGFADSEATTQVLDWLAAMNLTHKVAPTAQAVSAQQGGADQLFIGGKLAMYDTGRWPQAQFKQVEDLDFGTALPPIDADTGKRVTVLHEAGWCMNPASQYKDGATWNVLKFMGGPEANQIRTEAGWALPALPQIVEDLKLLEDPLEKTWFDAVPFATVSPCFMRTPNWDRADSELQNAIDTVFLGRATAMEAMSAAAPIADNMLAGA